jgi:hypothetical protein
VILDIQRLFPNIGAGRPETRSIGSLSELDDDRDRGAGRERVDRDVVLGRARHGVLPDLPRALPKLGRAEALVLVMLFALTLLLAASVIVPSIEARPCPAPRTSRSVSPRSATVPSSDRRRVRGDLCDHLGDLLGGPEGPMPWRSVWPGAAFFSIVTSVGNYIFPLYLDNISDLHRIGGTIGFILVALVWFYLISLALLAGAVINSLRHERDDTGTLPLEG